MTWQKVSTGTNGDVLDVGRQWSSVLPTDPSRGPDTPPTLYMTLGYGKLGLWRLTTGGRDWTDAWGMNIVLADGTNVAKDVGMDVGFVYAHGRVLKKVSSDILIDELFHAIDEWIAEGMHRPKRLKMAKPAALAMAEASLIPLE